MKFFLMISFLFPLLSFAGNKVIYGEDNRVEVFMANALHQELAQSTAAMINPTALSFDANTQIYTITGKSLSAKGVCSTEPFSSQKAPALCSGFLVADDILVTAGHCIKSQNDCINYRWVFGFDYAPASSGNYLIPSGDVYKCAEIIGRELNYETSNDYAVIRLDRKTNRTPLVFRREGKIDNRASLLVIGHPSGLPTKVATGGKIRNNDVTDFFVTNLDTYGGNSGSAVFDAYSGVVEGILVRGESDYIYDSARKCSYSRICTEDGCRGEDVTRITSVAPLMTSF